MAFYRRALAEEVHRNTYPDGRIVAELAVEGARFRVADQPYGLRQGRLADPFGHHWLTGRPLPGKAGDWARPTGG